MLLHTSRIEQMEQERTSEEFNMPGLGFEGGLLEQLQQGKSNFERKKSRFVI